MATLEFSEYQLSLIKSVLKNYLKDAEERNTPENTHSGVDRLLLGGVIIECRKLVDVIEAELEARKPVFTGHPGGDIEG